MKVFDFIISLFLIIVVQGQDPSDTSIFRNYEFEVFNDGKSYGAAKAVCEGRNAWLVEIKDEETQAAVRQLTTQYIWIGLHYDSGWKWNNIDALKYTNWATDNPRTISSLHNNYCGASITSDGKWLNNDCEAGLRYVCQLDLTWALYNSNLALTIISSPKKSVADATSSCTAIGKSLVSITTNALDSFLTAKLSHNGTINYWTSGSDSETEGSWKWGDGTAFGKDDQNWMRWTEWDEPNGGTNENCLMKYAGANYKWIDASCSAEAAYICQKGVSSGNCGSDVCLNKGSCKVKNSRYTCTCNAGYFGTKCEKDLISISTTSETRRLKSGESIDVQLDITSYDGNVTVDVRNQNKVKIKTVTTSNISSSNPSTTLTINIGPIEVLSTTILYKFEAGPQGNNLYSRVVVLTLVVNDACDSSPCNNGATCQYTTAEPYYNCTCRPEYNGTACEEPTYNLNKNCKYHVNFYKKKTFGDANTTCNSLGGTVAMMKTDAIQDFVESQIIDQYGKEGGTIAFWIGAYKPNTDWLWVDDTPITNNKWAWSSVSQGNGYLFMSSYLTTRNNMKWFNDDGSSNRGYVCEVPAIDRCSPSPCLNSGTCIQIGCQRKCKCMWGFTGENCETRISQISCFQSEISIKWNQEKHKFGSVYKLHLEDLMSKTSKVTNVQILLTNEPTINIRNVSEPTPIHCFSRTRLSISPNKYILVDLWVARIRMSLKSVAKVFHIFGESKFKLEFVDLA